MNLVKQNTLFTALLAAALLFCSMPAKSQCRAKFDVTVNALQVTFHDSSQRNGPVNYMWKFGDGQQSNQQSPVHTYQYPGEYWVELRIHNQNTQCNDVFRRPVCVRCVFPGDANTDGIVNNNDVLYLGIAFGAVGPLRPNQNTGGASVPWIHSNGPANFNNGVNIQHSDCDGNGVIDRTDIDTIRARYNQTALKTSVIAECVDIEDVPLFLVVPDSIEVGAAVSIEVHLGTSAIPAVDVYGIAFSINYDSHLIKDSTLTFDFTNSAFGTPSEIGTLDVDVPAASRIETAVTRIDQQEKTISGHIGTLSFVMEENLAEKTDATEIMNLSFSDITLIKANETTVAVCPYVDSAVVYEKLTSSNNGGAVQKQVLIYPNPANDFLKVTFPETDNFEVAVLNLLGKEIILERNSGGSYTLNTSTLARGVYFLSVRNNGAQQTFKFEIAR